MFGHLAVPGKHPTDDDLRKLMFGDYMQQQQQSSNYDEIKDFQLLAEVCLLLKTAICMW